MIPTLTLLESGFSAGINKGSNDLSAALGAAGGAVILCIILFKVFQSRGAFAGLIVAGIAGSFGWWLMKMNGLATLARVWDATISAWFK